MKISLLLLLLFSVLTSAEDNSKNPKQQDKIQFEEGLVEGVDKSKDFSSVTAKAKRGAKANIYDNDIGFGKMIAPTLRDMRFEQ